MTDKDESAVTYKDSGVDIEAGDQAVRLLAPLAQSTFNSRVLNDIGGFAGLYSLGSLCYNDPVLVSSTDGVGTKLKVAFMADRHDTVGLDLVAMSVNDVLVHGAQPLFFLDYLAMSKLAPEKVSAIVAGVAAGCRQAGCVLLGGETAEMPGFYQNDDYDLAGFAVGVVERSKIIDGSFMGIGHQIIGLPSSGLHSNGFSLARMLIFERLGLKIDSPLFDSTVADVLLTPTKIYVAPVLAVLKRFRVVGMAHVTGGGILGNLPRILPAGCRAVVRVNAWTRPPIFDLLAEAGRLDDGELHRTFNMGMGLLMVVPPSEVDGVMGVLEDYGERPVLIGSIEAQTDSRRIELK
jgi:phosphoribosylformylglycinamidine cyclo-ligase